jgi:hypothetical protein
VENTLKFLILRLVHGRVKGELKESIQVDVNEMNFGDRKWIKLTHCLVQLWAFVLKHAELSAFRS